jgi:hypothetical protein
MAVSKQTAKIVENLKSSLYESKALTEPYNQESPKKKPLTQMQEI